MIALGIVAGALVAAVVLSELALGGTKLQTGLGRALVVWAAVYLGASAALVAYGSVSVFVYTIFWAGAFLSWFGVRSHIESSILLRMLYLLRGRHMTGEALLAEYSSHYGEGSRVEELLRGKLATSDGERMTVTPKGNFILGVVARLR